MIGRASSEDWRALDLRAHAILEGVPLHDVWSVDLPGGGAGRTMEDVRSLLSVEALGEQDRIVRGLMGLRRALGRLFGWDREDRAGEASHFASRLDDRDREASLVPPGTSDGPFSALYVFPGEMLSEIRNATVHAFSCMALAATETGYRLTWAIYVLPVSWLTPLYMALIDPFRRFLIYPILLRRARATWVQRYGEDAEAGGETSPARD